MTGLVLTEQREPVRIVTLNQAELRNPISGMPMVDALVAVMKAAETIRVRAR